MAAKEESESTSLLDELSQAYGCSSHVTVKRAESGVDCITDYEPLKLSTFRIFCLAKGSIVNSPVLFAEAVLTNLMFILCAVPVYIYFKEDATGDVSLRRFLSKQEGKMRAFATIMTMLSSFLLSFYTTIIVGRWWTMRAQGVGAIKAATVDLHMLVYQCVTKNEQVLSAIRRYGRASLLLIFIWRRDQISELKQIMLKNGLLEEQECALLDKKHCLHETIWAWQAAIVSKLHKEGLIKSDELLSMLLNKCTEGRAAAQCVHTHLAVRVPMMYVHLLGLLVKMHNLVLAVIMGLLFGAALRNGYIILCIQLWARTQILPFLFNAILLINGDLADPFNGGEADFPGEIYQETLEKDCVGIQKVANSVPKWLEESPA